MRFLTINKMAMGDTYKRRPNFDLGATVSLDVSKSAEESLAENPRHRDIVKSFSSTRHILTFTTPRMEVT